MSTYQKCDRCGLTNERPDSLLHFWTLIAEHTTNIRNGHREIEVETEICTNCCVELKTWLGKVSTD